MARTRDDEAGVYSITGASTPHSDDLDQRIGRYLVSMGIRTACVILVIVVQHPTRWVFAVGAVVLPYVAVILANNAGPRRGRPAPPVPPQTRAPVGSITSPRVTPSTSQATDVDPPEVLSGVVLDRPADRSSP